MNAQWGNAQLRVYERALWSYERARVHNRDLMNARARSSRVHKIKARVHKPLIARSPIARSLQGPVNGTKVIPQPHDYRFRIYKASLCAHEWDGGPWYWDVV